MSTIQDLLQRIEQLEKEKDQERREKEGAQHLNRINRNTTLEEYLRACYEDVLSKICLVTDGYLTTKVPTTSPARKHCPNLVPWDDFESKQDAMIERIDKIFPHDERLFESSAFLQGMGNRLSKRPVQDEASLLFIQNNAIEDPVRLILSKLNDFHPERYGLAIPEQVDFQTTASRLRDPTDMRDTVERDARLRTDQICVYRNSRQKDIAYVIEYKAPHKLHTAHLEQGLRPMNIFEEVVNKQTIPTTEPDKFKHYAELLSAAAIAQTYHYMLEAGLEYGYLTNGDAIVFLEIDWADPKMLRYHLARPSREATEDQEPAWGNAVCQVLAFTIMALQSGYHGNNERVAAAAKCEKWEVDFNYILDKIIKEEEREERSNPTTPGKRKHRRVPSSPEWQPTPIKRRRRNPRQHSPPGDSDRVLRSRNKRDGPEEGAGSGGDSGGGGGVGGSSHAGGSPQAPGGPGDGSGTAGWPSRLAASGNSPREMPGQYCTRACMLSLVNNRLLDSRCPNVAMHRTGMRAKVEDVEKHKKTQKPQRHPISYLQFMDLLREQFSQGLEPGVVVLGKEGACGALFQITLSRYGYTLIAKGVTGGRVPELEKEVAVYQKLRSLQGRGIPVCLGSVDLKPLKQVFYYDLDVRIIRFMLLSYAGTEVRARRDETKARIISTVTLILDEMHCLGVTHGDIRWPNVLQGPDGEINLVDFDRAVFLPAKGQHTLSGIPPNKRRRLMETEGEEPLSAKQEQLSQTAIQQDNGNAHSLFSLDCGRIVGQRV
ncbi:hypothetical protein CMQ_5509 [Grosmannia clavigera kw1407]|uniref:Protein kinase domain-containing protein n=1 Tax=Grosmannia clavigera (strain kw1407 / UAMH 11150) TaxID=655863 RepID=F0XST0_GROCL|nr:uncharacterized protein CMQ_5509 [Grosmannia clavigera kw1407]EFW99088.1 hypothetical protein CMQ_5509 [Grosmannia clavigera kw1407]